MQVLTPAAIYFVVVFTAGFVFGTVRVLWVAPRMGARVAELLELPFMLVVIVYAARWIHFRFLAHVHQPTRALVGILALLFLLVAEVALGVTLRGLSLKEALISRDPVSGTAYYLSLCVFALMPCWLGRKARLMEAGR